MIRTILLSALALAAAAGAAQAETLKVSLQGKTEAAVRAEVLQAAKQACGQASASDYAVCVHETYQNAMVDVSRAKAARLAGATF